MARRQLRVKPLSRDFVEDFLKEALEKADEYCKRTLGRGFRELVVSIDFSEDWPYLVTIFVEVTGSGDVRKCAEEAADIIVSSISKGMEKHGFKEVY